MQIEYMAVHKCNLRQHQGFNVPCINIFSGQSVLCMNTYSINIYTNMLHTVYILCTEYLKLILNRQK